MHFIIVKKAIRKEIKNQIKKGISEDKLCIFKMCNADYTKLKWYEKDKEFSILKKMYDIVRSIKRNDSITLYCINDKQEEILFAGLNQMVNKALQSNSKYKQFLKDNNYQFYSEIKKPEIILPYIKTTINTQLSFYFFTYHRVIPHPPNVLA